MDRQVDEYINECFNELVNLLRLACFSFLIQQMMAQTGHEHAADTVTYTAGDDVTVVLGEPPTPVNGPPATSSHCPC